MADNVDITAGSGTAVATDEASDGSHVQLFKLAYSANGSRVLVQVDANGVLVNPRPPAYDSGLTTLPDALTVLTASTIYALGILLCNLTSAAVTVTLTNTAGDFYLKAFPLQASMTVYVPLGRAAMVGAKWNASAAASVNAQLVGE